MTWENGKTIQEEGNYAKPCPFCGESENLYVQHMKGTEIHPTYSILCDYCGARGGWSDNPHHPHFEKWNIRPGKTE